MKIKTMLCESYTNCNLDYILYDQFHRTDGSVIMYCDPNQPNFYSYYNNEVQVTNVEDFNRQVKLLSIS